MKYLGLFVYFTVKLGFWQKIISLLLTKYLKCAIIIDSTVTREKYRETGGKPRKRRGRMRNTAFALAILAAMVLGFLAGASKTNTSADTTAPATAEVVEAAQPETPATSSYPMTPPKVVVLSEMSQEREKKWGTVVARYRYISIDGKIAIQFVGPHDYGISFVPQDAVTAAEAEDNTAPPTPK